MFVRNFMTKDPITVSLDATLPSTADLMKQHNLKRLPVMDQDKLVGIITEKDVAKALPSPATTLSKYEINYLTEKIRVKDVMTKAVISVSPDTTVEEATMIMHEEDVGCLPVLENGKLVGIITERNIYNALTKLFGLDRPGLRITVQVEDRIGVIADLTTLIKSLNLPIISLATYAASAETAYIVVRIATDSPESLIGTLTGNGFQVVHWTMLNEQAN
ncbi:MAG: CBS domain-containing protein [Limnochordia bacterium]|jgi:acetoin utilization protein AcuB|nr:CBS domain-containing protein [Bacillota bacterium]HOB08599.1 CBS domain-containing protein [Limnochordia bacterium]HXK96561.1 CBS domain-containing protein [Limnochordia bacterium]